MCVYTVTMSSTVVCMHPLSSTDVVLGQGLSRRLWCLSKQTTKGISQEQQWEGPQESSPTDSTGRISHQRNWSIVHATKIQKSQTALLWLRMLCKCSFNVSVWCYIIFRNAHSIHYMYWLTFQLPLSSFCNLIPHKERTAASFCNLISFSNLISFTQLNSLCYIAADSCS